MGEGLAPEVSLLFGFDCTGLSYIHTGGSVNPAAGVPCNVKVHFMHVIIRSAGSTIVYPPSYTVYGHLFSSGLLLLAILFFIKLDTLMLY